MTESPENEALARRKVETADDAVSPKLFVSPVGQRSTLYINPTTQKYEFLYRSSFYPFFVLNLCVTLIFTGGLAVLNVVAAILMVVLIYGFSKMKSESGEHKREKMNMSLIAIAGIIAAVYILFAMTISLTLRALNDSLVFVFFLFVFYIYSICVLVLILLSVCEFTQSLIAKELFILERALFGVYPIVSAHIVSFAILYTLNTAANASPNMLAFSYAGVLLFHYAAFYSVPRVCSAIDRKSPQFKLVLVPGEVVEDAYLVLPRAQRASYTLYMLFFPLLLQFGLYLPSFLLFNVDGMINCMTDMDFLFASTFLVRLLLRQRPYKKKEKKKDLLGNSLEGDTKDGDEALEEEESAAMSEYGLSFVVMLVLECVLFLVVSSYTASKVLIPLLEPMLVYAYVWEVVMVGFATSSIVVSSHLFIRLRAGRMETGSYPFLGILLGIYMGFSVLFIAVGSSYFLVVPFEILFVMTSVFYVLNDTELQFFRVSMVYGALFGGLHYFVILVSFCLGYPFSEIFTSLLVPIVGGGSHVLLLLSFLSMKHPNSHDFGLDTFSFLLPVGFLLFSYGEVILTKEYVYSYYVQFLTTLLGIVLAQILPTHESSTYAPYNQWLLNSIIIAKNIALFSERISGYPWIVVMSCSILWLWSSPAKFFELHFAARRFFFDVVAGTTLLISLLALWGDLLGSSISLAIIVFVGGILPALLHYRHISTLVFAGVLLSVFVGVTLFADVFALVSGNIWLAAVLLVAYLSALLLFFVRYSTEITKVVLRLGISLAVSLLISMVAVKKEFVYMTTFWEFQLFWIFLSFSILVTMQVTSAPKNWGIFTVMYVAYCISFYVFIFSLAYLAEVPLEGEFAFNVNIVAVLSVLYTVHMLVVYTLKLQEDEAEEKEEKIRTSYENFTYTSERSMNREISPTKSPIVNIRLLVLVLASIVAMHLVSRAGISQFMYVVIVPPIWMYTPSVILRERGTTEEDVVMGAFYVMLVYAGMSSALEQGKRSVLLLLRDSLSLIFQIPGIFLAFSYWMKADFYYSFTKLFLTVPLSVLGVVLTDVSFLWLVSLTNIVSGILYSIICRFTNSSRNLAV